MHPASFGSLVAVALLSFAPAHSRAAENQPVDQAATTAAAPDKGAAADEPAKGGNCSACEKKFVEFERQKKQLDVNSQFLGKNRDFLRMLSSKEASKFLKVSGNMKVILKQMDEIKARIAKLESEISEMNCDRCKPEKKREQQ